jgi:hypothetical protein
MPLYRLLGALLCAPALFACGGGDGGGGGGGNPPMEPPTFSGTVAIGEPLAGATVEVIHGDGIGASAVTDAAGRYSVTLSGVPAGARPVFMLRATIPLGGSPNAPTAYPRLYSIANRTSGTVNVTPLTSLLVARLLGERQGIFTNLLTLRDLPTPSDSEIDTAHQQVVSYLLQRPDPNNGNATVAVDVSAVTDFIGAPFNAVSGNPHDDAIERLAQTLMPGETIMGVEEHMLARSDPPADLSAVLSLDLVADCVAQGSSSGLPTGRVDVSLRPSGQIIIGSYTYTLVTGDRVTRSNGPLFDERWVFELTASGITEQLELTEASRRLNSLVLSRPPGSAVRCTPNTELPLGARVPSALAQVRKLAQDFNGPTPTLNFTCPAGSVFPGVNDGANVLEIQDNGALRLNGSGHAFHLPSLSSSIRAVITNSSGLLTTQVRAAAFERALVGGFDSFTLTLDPNGNVQTIRFAQQRDAGPILSKNCP